MPELINWRYSCSLVSHTGCTHTLCFPPPSWLNLPTGNVCNRIREWNVESVSKWAYTSPYRGCIAPKFILICVWRELFRPNRVISCLLMTWLETSYAASCHGNSGVGGGWGWGWETWLRKWPNAVEFQVHVGRCFVVTCRYVAGI